MGKRPQPDLEERRQHVRMPSDSVFYDRVLPILFVVLGLITLLIILIAAGVLLGVVPWH